MADVNGRWPRILFAALLFGAIFALRLVVPAPGDGILFLLIGPIALLAAEFGISGGLAGAVVATAMTLFWVGVFDPEVTPIGVASRVLAFVTVGAGVGYGVSSQLRREERLRELEKVDDQHQRALELNDAIVEGLAIARMALEMGDKDKAAEAIDRSLAQARSVISKGVVSTESFVRPAPRS